MKKSMQAALAATLVVGLAGSAHADLNLQGEVGLPLNPTAQIPDQGGARVQGNYYDMKAPGASIKYYGLDAAGGVGQNIEISGGVNKLSAPNALGIDRTGISVGAKYLFTRETDPANVRIAAGIGYNRALLSNVHGYIVASKYLGTVTTGRAPVIGHLGVRYDRFTVPGGGPRSNKASVYAGAEVPVTRDGAFQLVGEIQSKNNNFGGGKTPYSAAVRFRPVGQGFSASLGIQRQGLINTGGKFFVQIGSTFGTRGGATAGTTTQ
ncbi:MAG: hypothetical protein JO316_13195 [Abitibacteriaceae bacterium]|nr:hypothetical protein [Abditibacteriaceae bacterium]MBV9866301.1 hypothetical protein [Abditibacteriaceae bacterium]